MFEELSSDDKRFIVEYVRDLFGDGVVSFMRVVADHFVDVLVTRSVERDGVRRWESIYVDVTPERAVTSLHYVDGLYRVSAADENEFKRLINSWRGPASAQFIGGVAVPRSVKEFCYQYSYSGRVWLTDGSSLVLVDFARRGPWVVPKSLLLSLRPPPPGGLFGVNLRRTMLDGGYKKFGAPLSLLVRGAPDEYYEAAVEVLLSRGGASAL